MATLPEDNSYPAGVYQIEQTDPVLGGPPNEATGAGLVNIPAQHLAKRTNWLRIRIDALLARTVTGAGLASGGGPLSADRVITVADATQAEAEAGIVTTKAMSPWRVTQAIVSRLLPYGFPGGRAVTDLNDLTESGFGGALAGPANGPGWDYPAVITARRAVARCAQIGLTSNVAAPRLAVRSQDGSGTYGAWSQAWLGQAAGQSLAGSGYQVMPSGLILQWGAFGVAGAADSGTELVTFPLAFPNACLQAFAHDPNSVLAATWFQTSAHDWTPASMSLSYKRLGGAAAITTVNWFAIGR